MTNDDDDDNEYIENCRNCGSAKICQMEGTALFFGGNEYWVMCFDCAAAGESSYDFGIKEDAEECRFVAREFWNSHGWTSKRSSIVALFSQGEE